MWMRLKGVLCMCALLLCFSVPVTGWAANQYTVTGQELEALENIFRQLETKQKQQQALLNRQAEQLTMLRGQLETSKKQISSSQMEMEKLQTSLDGANKSLQESAAEAKRTRDRLDRQRDTWAAVAVLILGVAVMD